ncbi:endolytic transglycosylase MltG [Candidatus Uhrbacteria bacterium]|nr:endolytic transglycosylase MltG [Candidatus Uhrbacteria bacterium]
MKKILFFLGVLLIGAGAFLAWFVPRAWLATPGEPYATKKITIGEDWDASRMAQELKKEGLIDSEFGYRMYAYFDKSADKPRAGEYDLFLKDSYRSIARTIFRGPQRDEVEIRIIEGLSLTQEAEVLAGYKTKVEDFYALTGNAKQPFSTELRTTFPFLEKLPVDATLEGYLFPETFRVWRDQLPLALIEKQLTVFEDRTKGMAEEAVKQGRDFRDVMILASIVEKEAAGADDRKIVAGIYLNRLKKGMLLQSDATVNYVTGAGRARPVLKDLDVDSPYNTYKHKGLPPGPICNPSLESIEAALHPTATDYLYYLHDDAGKSYYAKTLEEHKQNRYKAYGE